jgi:hypothetical protein
MKQDFEDMNDHVNYNLVVYDKIQTTYGQLGSPIFYEFHSHDDSQISEYQLIGVHTGSNEKENFGTYFENLSYENLKKIYCPDESKS